MVREVTHDVSAAIKFRHDGAQLDAQFDIDMSIRRRTAQRDARQTRRNFLESSEKIPDFSARMADAERKPQRRLRPGPNRVARLHR